MIQEDGLNGPRDFSMDRLSSNSMQVVVIISFLAFVTFLFSVLGIIPDHVASLRLDLALYKYLIVAVIALHFIKKGFRQAKG
jgi:hypothetical protein